MRGGLFSGKAKATPLPPDQVAFGHSIDVELWEVELDGEIREASLGWHGISAERARLVRRIETWSDETAGEFAKECILRARDLVAEGTKRLSESPQAADRGVAFPLREAADQLAAAGTRHDIEVAAEVLVEVDPAPALLGEWSPIGRVSGGIGGQDLWLAARSVTDDPPPQAAAKAAALRIFRAGSLAYIRAAIANPEDINAADAANEEASKEECRSASASLLGHLSLIPSV